MKNRFVIGFLMYAVVFGTCLVHHTHLIMHLGELEKLVLQYLWDTGTADAKQVFAYFERWRGGSLNTIQSTLDRLFKKGLLSRDKQGHAFQYTAAVGRDKFIGQLINEISSDFGSTGENTLLAAFTSLSTGLDEAQLDELERLIEQRRSKVSSGPEE